MEIFKTFIDILAVISVGVLIFYTAGLFVRKDY